MAYFVLDSRCRQIIDYLAAQNEYKTCDDIARILSISRNSVKYSLSKISGLLLEQGQGAFEKKRGLGTRLTSEQKKWWSSISHRNADLEYVLTQDERIAVIICLLIVFRKDFSIESTARLMKVSRNTIFADLRGMKKLLARFNIKISYDISSGYMLSGDELALRSLLLHQFSVLAELIEQQILDIFKRQTNLLYLEKLRAMQKSLGLKYAREVIDKLAILLLYVYSGNSSEPVFTDEQKNDITSTNEFAAVNIHFADLPESEKVYLACQLLGNQAMEHLNGTQINGKKSYSPAENLVLYFERLTGVSFEDRNGLISELFYHITRAVYRHKYGMIFQEQINPPVYYQQTELLSVMRIIIDELCEDIGYYVDDNELALLSMCFYKHLQQIPFKFDRVSALLVVNQLTDDVQALSNMIMSYFPMLRIQATISVNDFYRQYTDQRFIISTVPLNTDSSYALINERMENGAYDILIRYYMKYRFGRSIDEIDDLMRRLGPYIHKDSSVKVKAEVISFLFGKTFSLSDILLPDYVQTGLSPKCWQDAIRAAAAPLVENDAATGEYIDSIINSISMYGSYSFITEGVYLAHAEINGNVNKLALGLAAFSQPISFPDGKKASILLIMCPTDKHSHFEAFKEVVRICEQKDLVKSMVAANSPKMLFDLVMSEIK